MHDPEDSTVPSFLRSTWRMLVSAYPSGVPESDYLALIKALVEHASQRVIADIVSHFTGRKRAVVYNDVLGVAGGDPEIEESDMNRVLERLRQAGYDDGVQEED